MQDRETVPPAGQKTAPATVAATIFPPPSLRVTHPSDPSNRSDQSYPTNPTDAPSVKAW
jgi:hypothetical protein